MKSTSTVTIPHAPLAALKLARDLYRNGWTYRQIASAFDVSVSTAYDMVNLIPQPTPGWR